MRHCLVIAAAAAAAWLALAPAAHAAEPGSAAAYVESLYVGQEIPGESARYSPRIETLWSDCEDWAVANDEMCMDFSMFVMGQDYELTGLAFATEADDGKAARVQASFQNFGKDVVVTFDIVRDGRGWTIDEITSGCETLSAILTRQDPSC